MRQVYFHEDDYGLTEILPAQNWSHCAQQLQCIEEFSQQHLAPDGAGWTHAYRVQPVPVGLSTLALSMDHISQRLARFLQPFDAVGSNYLDEDGWLARTCAFGFHEDCMICITHDNANRVSRICLLLLGCPSREEQAAVAAALGALAQCAPMLLCDWGFGQLFLLHDGAATQAYFHELEALYQET